MMAVPPMGRQAERSDHDPVVEAALTLRRAGKQIPENWRGYLSLDSGRGLTGAEQRVVEDHLPLVRHVAWKHYPAAMRRLRGSVRVQPSEWRRYSGEDLLHAGVQRMIEAVISLRERPSPLTGSALSQYLVRCVKTGMMHFEISHREPVELPAKRYLQVRQNYKGTKVSDETREALLKRRATLQERDVLYRPDRRSRRTSRPFVVVEDVVDHQEWWGLCQRARRIMEALAHGMEGMDGAIALAVVEERTGITCPEWQTSFIAMGRRFGVPYHRVQNLERRLLASLDRVLRGVPLAEEIQRLCRTHPKYRARITNRIHQLVKRLGEAGRRMLFAAAAEIGGRDTIPAIVTAAARLCPTSADQPTRKALAGSLGITTARMKVIESRIQDRFQAKVRGAAA
jgi:predicted metal-dependent hydrolase